MQGLRRTLPHVDRSGQAPSAPETDAGAWPVVREAPKPPTASQTRTALQERIQGILARNARPNPVAADEARILGERDDDASLPSDPSLTHTQAVDNLVAGLPVKDVRTRLKTEDGRWVDPATGIVSDTFDG